MMMSATQQWCQNWDLNLGLSDSKTLEFNLNLLS